MGISLDQAKQDAVADLQQHPEKYPDYSEVKVVSNDTVVETINA